MSFPYNYYLNYNVVQQHRFDLEEKGQRARGNADSGRGVPDATPGGGFDAATAGSSTAPMSGGLTSAEGEIPAQPQDREAGKTKDRSSQRRRSVRSTPYRPDLNAE